MVKGMGLNYGLLRVSILAFFSLFIDLSHVIGILGLFHNVFVLAFLILLYLWFSWNNSENSKNYLLIFLVMVAGHFIADMIFGIGIPLLFPFSNSYYLIPQYGICLRKYGIYIAQGSDLVECLVTPFGIALTLYFGIIALVVVLRRHLHNYLNL